MPISIPERGSSEISNAQLETLQSSVEFWALVNRGIVDVTLRPGGGAQLSAGPYVGRAICGGEILEVREKIPGALGSLLRYASESTFRLESATGARTEIGPLITLIVSLFLTEVSRYLAIGKEFRYSQERHVSPMVAGVIRIPATAQIWARGLVHQIAFDRKTITHETDKNIVLKRALREIEHIAEVVELDEGLVAKAHALSMYLKDYPSKLNDRRSELARTAENLVLSDTRDSDLLSLAALLLRHESFEHTDWLGDTTPKTWFVNLERLFEYALLRQINRVQYAGIIARRGKSRFRSIYSQSTTDPADPDILLLQSEEVVGIGDAKYKNWSGRPERSDVYQLLVHAAAFRSPVSFLAFGSDEFRTAFLGHSVTGTSVHAYALDISDLDTCVNAMLSDLDAPVSV